MLDLFKSLCIRFCFIITIIFLINFSICSTFPIYGVCCAFQEITPVEYKWIEEYLQHMNETSSPKEWINFFLRLKIFLKNKGCKSSSLIEMAEVYREKLKNHGITLSEEAFNYLTNLISGKQSNFILTRNYHSKKHKEETNVPAGLVIGFVKCLAGGLLCIIPAPVAQGIGVGLIVSGINDCLAEAKNQSDINEQDSINGTTWSYTF